MQFVRRFSHKHMDSVRARLHRRFPWLHHLLCRHLEVSIHHHQCCLIRHLWVLEVHSVLLARRFQTRCTPRVQLDYQLHHLILPAWAVTISKVARFHLRVWPRQLPIRGPDHLVCLVHRLPGPEVLRLLLPVILAHTEHRPVQLVVDLVDHSFHASCHSVLGLVLYLPS